MRDFALTYPQLVRQAMTAGFGDQELRELRKVFDSVQREFDGLYRAGGQPFICHTVRTASIVLAESQPFPVIEAALVHAVYDAHRYDGSTRSSPGPRQRKRLQHEVGADVEQLVWAFHQIAWERVGAPGAQPRDLPHASDMVRLVLTLRVANDLENHMDLAINYRTGQRFKDRIDSDGAAIEQLAKELGMPTLAEELSVVFREVHSETLPAAVRWDRSRGYELPVHATSRTRRVTRFSRRVQRGLTRRLRSLHRSHATTMRQERPHGACQSAPSTRSVLGHAFWSPVQLGASVVKSSHCCGRTFRPDCLT